MATVNACSIIAFGCALLLSSQALAVTIELVDWRLASSLNVSASGAIVSSPHFSVQGWFNAKLPCTVLACLQQNGLYTDPFYAGNIYAIDPLPFNQPWWYRTEFSIPSGTPSTVILRFRGLNYRADVWVNGELVAANATTVGAFRHFSFDVTSVAAPPASPTAVAVLVSRPHDDAIE
jgi:exo-1,4-beta-D-glucosaminidase